MSFLQQLQKRCQQLFPHRKERDYFMYNTDFFEEQLGTDVHYQQASPTLSPHSFVVSIPFPHGKESTKSLVTKEG